MCREAAERALARACACQQPRGLDASPDSKCGAWLGLARAQPVVVYPSVAVPCEALWRVFRRGAGRAWCREGAKAPGRADACTEVLCPGQAGPRPVVSANQCRAALFTFSLGLQAKGAVYTINSTSTTIEVAQRAMPKRGRVRRI